jgi:succinate dehydrogenase flavin-adding protein (antitoxin of CptAB toxin-antitoxin module)
MERTMNTQNIGEAYKERCIRKIKSNPVYERLNKNHEYTFGTEDNPKSDTENRVRAMQESDSFLNYTIKNYSELDENKKTELKDILSNLDCDLLKKFENRTITRSELESLLEDTQGILSKVSERNFDRAYSRAQGNNLVDAAHFWNYKEFPESKVSEEYKNYADNVRSVIQVHKSMNEDQIETHDEQRYQEWLSNNSYVPIIKINGAVKSGFFSRIIEKIFREKK